jgi:hypothetical protein
VVVGCGDSRDGRAAGRVVVHFVTSSNGGMISL